MEARTLVENSFRFSLNNQPVSDLDVFGIIAAVRQNASLLHSHLYDAIVQLHNHTVLTASLNGNQLNKLKDIIQTAKNQAIEQALFKDLNDLESTTDAYLNLLASRQRRGGGSVRKKKPPGFEKCLPRHRLRTVGGEIYENLTWVTPEEKQRLQNRYAQYGGVALKTIAGKARHRHVFGQLVYEEKVTFGEGAFGGAMLARKTSTDEYLVHKKIKPQPLLGPNNMPTGLLIRPQVARPVPMLTDGSISGISKIEARYQRPSKLYENFNLPNFPDDYHFSVYLYTELGVTDLQDFFDKFFVLNFAFSAHCRLHSTRASEIYAELVNKLTRENYSTQQIFQNGAFYQSLIIRSLEQTPLVNKELQRRFQNTLALQVLESIKALHSAGFAHFDIKPNNLVFGLVNGEGGEKFLRAKLIDFDFLDSIQDKIGVPRKDNVCMLYAAPQIDSSYENNNPALNDAYSAGITLHQLAGESVFETVVRQHVVHDLNKNPLRRSGVLPQAKPVQHRRDLEAKAAVIPELLSLSDLADLLCHPHAGKRITVNEAIRNPLFTGHNLMDPQEFTQHAKTILKLAAHIDLNHYQADFFNPETEQGLMAALEAFTLVKSEMKQHIQTKCINSLGAQRYFELHAQAKKLVADENFKAIGRRLARGLDLNLWLKNRHQKEGMYRYKEND